MQREWDVTITPQGSMEALALQLAQHGFLSENHHQPQDQVKPVVFAKYGASNQAPPHLQGPQNLKDLRSVRETLVHIVDLTESLAEGNTKRKA